MKAFRKGGIDALEPKSTQPKTSPQETPIWIKERVIELRKETGLCAKKLHWRLAKQGLAVPVSTIGKILKDEGLTRKYRVKKIKYKYIKAERKPGELVEIDVKYVPRTVERSHREDQRFYDKNKFKSLGDLKNKIQIWNDEYNNLEHCGLNGKTPIEFLADYQLIRPPNVCA